jgi:Domain of unknown function (DUF1929)/Kelch motif
MSRRGFLLSALAAAAGASAVALLRQGNKTHSPDTNTTVESYGHLAGSWGASASLGMVAPIHASLLRTGEVLMAGVDHQRSRFPNFILDPAASGPFQIEAMAVPMRHHKDSLICAGHAFLADGRMLQVGGQHLAPELGLDYGLVFDARVKGSLGWSAIRPDLIGGPAWYPTVTRLADGQMLVISGFSDFGSVENRTIQTFDPVDLDGGRHPWKQLASHEEVPDVSPTGADYTHTFLLPRPIMVDARPRQVAMFGRTGLVHLFNPIDHFDDAADRFATKPNGHRPGPRGVPASAAGASSALLADGRILIAGGGEEGGEAATSMVDIYDPADDTWRSLDTGIKRSHPGAVLLPDGTVLIVNGDGDAPDEVSSPQIFDPESEAVTTGPPCRDGKRRGYHNVALLLPDGRVLTAGGELGGEESERPDLRLFSPPYLSPLVEGQRPRILSAPLEMGYGRAYPIGFRGGPVQKVTLVGLGSMTHSFDQNQRLVVLYEGEAVEEAVTIVGPSDSAVAPPGDYMLFVLRKAQVRGISTMVPSPAWFIRVS